MKRMYSDNAQDLKIDSQPWAHTIDLINGAIGLRAVGSTDVKWSDGITKFFYPKGGSGANRFQGGMRVQPYMASGPTPTWTEIKKTDFNEGEFPAPLAKTEVIFDLNSDDTVQIPNDAFRISSKSGTAESTLIVINRDTQDVIHKINYASTANAECTFDAWDFISQIKEWYREKGWVETDGESETIVIPSDYVIIQGTYVAVKGEALPPEVRIKYNSDPNNHIYVLPRTIVMPE